MNISLRYFSLLYEELPLLQYHNLNYVLQYYGIVRNISNKYLQKEVISCYSLCFLRYYFIYNFSWLESWLEIIAKQNYIPCLRWFLPQQRITPWLIHKVLQGGNLETWSWFVSNYLTKNELQKLLPSLLLLASYYGHIAIFNSFNVKKITNLYDIYCLAIERGQLLFLQWICRHHILTWHKEFVMSAVKYGHKKLLVWMWQESKKSQWCKDFTSEIPSLVILATQKGHLSCLRWLLQADEGPQFPYHTYIYIHAKTQKQERIILWLEKQGYVKQKYWHGRKQLEKIWNNTNYFYCLQRH